MTRRSDPCWDLDGPEYEPIHHVCTGESCMICREAGIRKLKRKTELEKTNTKMLQDILDGVKKMNNPWNEPSPEDLSYLGSASIEAQIDALLDELHKRDKKMAMAYLKISMLRLSGPTNAEPFLPIAHRS